MKRTHIRSEYQFTDISEVVTLCGDYEGSSVSFYHIGKVLMGEILPFSRGSVQICPNCLFEFDAILGGRK